MLYFFMIFSFLFFLNHVSELYFVDTRYKRQCLNKSAGRKYSWFLLSFFCSSPNRVRKGILYIFIISSSVFSPFIFLSSASNFLYRLAAFLFFWRIYLLFISTFLAIFSLLAACFILTRHPTCVPLLDSRITFLSISLLQSPIFLVAYSSHAVLLFPHVGMLASCLVTSTKALSDRLTNWYYWITTDVEKVNRAKFSLLPSSWERKPPNSVRSLYIKLWALCILILKIDQTVVFPTPKYPFWPLEFRWTNKNIKKTSWTSHRGRSSHVSLHCGGTLNRHSDATCRTLG